MYWNANIAKNTKIKIYFNRSGVISNIAAPRIKKVKPREGITIPINKYIMIKGFNFLE